MTPNDPFITEELWRRPARAPEYQDENGALGELATAMSRSPSKVAGTLLELILRLSGAGSAGISLLENETFRWHITSGALPRSAWDFLAASLSPYRAKLKCGKPVLLVPPFGHRADIEPPIVEILLIPYCHREDAVGAIWVVAHPGNRIFDVEDARLVASLARFASAATQNMDNLQAVQAANERLTQEIAEREQTEEALRQSERRHRFLSDLAAATQHLTDPDEVMAVTARRLGEYLGVDRCAYAEVEPGEGYCHLTGNYTHGVPSIIGRYACSGFGIEALRQLRNNRPYIVYDVQTDEKLADFRSFYEGLRIRAQICVPVRKDGALAGLVAVHQSTPRRWTEDEIELVRLVAGRAWESIERGRVLRRLRATDERLQLLIGHSIDFAVIMTDPDSRIVEWKGGAEHITGWSEAEVIGKPASLIFTPDDIAVGQHEQELKTAREHGRAADKRWHIRKDGSLFFADGVMVSLRGPNGELRGFGKVLTDATERKRTEDQIAALLEIERNRSDLLRRIADTSRAVNASLSVESIARLISDDARQLVGAHQAALSFTPDNDWAQAVDVLSLSDKYRSYRGQAVKLGHLGLRSLIGRSSQVLRMTQRELEAHADWAAFAGEGEYRLPMRGWLAAPLISPSGASLGMLQFSDKFEGEFSEEDEAIAAQIAAIAAIAVHNAELYEKLREQDRRKDEFLATLAHELRNPLAPIRTGLEVMKLSPTRSERDRTREMMERQLGHMVHLIDDLLDISRVSRGKVELKKEHVAIQSLIDDAVETSLPLIRAAQHELTIQLPDEPVYLDADPTRITQVISNLVNNAAKYTPRHGHIAIRAERQGAQLCVHVRDDGIGIPQDMLSKIFDIFAQVGRVHGQTQGGLGIGLSLVKRLVEMHGGSVEAVSDGAGRGSVFTVRLPLAPEQFHRERNVNAHAPSSVESTQAPLKILVVDDNTDAAESLALLMQIRGYECRTAYSGPQALETAQAYHPDLVFLDIGLPGMSGYEVAQQLRGDLALGHPTLVALTGWGTEADRQRTRGAGFDHHLTKPVDLHEVDRLFDALEDGAAANPRSALPPAREARG